MDRLREAEGGKFFLLIVVVWLTCGLVCTAGVWAMGYSNQRLYSTLKERGVVVRATITETDPGNHDMVYYSFVDRGETYSSSDNSSLPNPSASDLAIGDELYVVYDTMDPSSSCACDPHAAAVSSEWWRMFVAGMLLGSVPAAVVMARFDSRRSPSIDKREEGELGGELPPYQP